MIEADQTAEVGSKPAGVSWVGAQDMSGNVWEWTHSILSPYPYAADDGRELDFTRDVTSERVLRGGSWYYDEKQMLLSAMRIAFEPDMEFKNIGFRCVMDY